ncbi:MAG: DMT family transporter [Anaerolineae bacterium]
MPSEKPPIPPGVGLTTGVLAVSTASTLIRLAQRSAPSLVVAAWRLTFAAALLLPVALVASRQEWRRLARREWGWMIASGALLAAHFYTWITSLALTSVAASIALVSMTPLFVAVLSYLFLQEEVSQRMLIGMVVAVVGSVVIGLEDFGEGSHALLGDGLALLGSITVAGHLIIGRRLRARLSLVSYIFPVYAIAAVISLCVTLMAGLPLLGYPSRTWLWLFLVALIPQLIGHSSFNWALRLLSPTYVALATLAEPIGSTLLAWAILSEIPTLITAFGGALVLIGIAIATLRPRNGQPSRGEAKRIRHA